MSRAARARRIATAAAFGGGSVGALSAAVVGLVYGETKLARRRIKPNPVPPPVADGIWTAPGVSARRVPLRISVLGDSSAAGYGLTDAGETPAAVFARGLSALSRRPVDVTCVAEVGGQSSWLGPQVEKVLPHRPELALIMIGANDVTHRVRRAVAVRHLAAAVEMLRGHDCQVIVGTCPDLGTIRPIAQPLRTIARRISRTLAAAQTIAVVEAGGRSVSLGDILGPSFEKDRGMFGDDEFHPSARGYAAAAEVALPSAAAALGLPTHADSAGPFLTTRVRPIAKAAARAAAHPGTEVEPAQVGGEDRGRRGRWARLARRRSQTVVEAAAAFDDTPLDDTPLDDTALDTTALDDTALDNTPDSESVND